MLVRAMGMEEEFGHRVTHPDFDFRAVKLLGTSNRWLGNGGRHYVDNNEHLESSGAEGTTGEEIKNNALGNERLLQERLVEFEEQIADDTGIMPRVYLFKGNLVSLNRKEPPNTYGCHENYQVWTQLPLGVFARPLIPFLVTRQIMLGIGYYRSVKAGSISYQLSQRAWFTDAKISSGTTNNRGIINVREEPHASESKRLHLICGDNNFLPKNTAFKFDLTALMLTILEAGGLKKSISLKDPLSAVRQVSSGLDAEIDLEDGTKMTALEIQRYYLRVAKEFVSGSGVYDRFNATLERWGHLLDLLEFGTLIDLVGEIDWATKRYIVESAEARGPLSDDEIIRLDLACSQIHGRGRLLRYVEETYASDVDWQAVETAKVVPPQTTRARIRSAALGAGCTVDWAHYKYRGKVHHLSDPLETEIPSRLLASA